MLSSVQRFLRISKICLLPIFIGSLSGGINSAISKQNSPIIPVANIFTNSAKLPAPEISADGQYIGYFTRASTLVVARTKSPKVPVSTLPDKQHCITKFQWLPKSDSLLLYVRSKCKINGYAINKNGGALLKYTPKTGAIDTLLTPFPRRSKVHMASEKPGFIFITHNMRNPKAENGVLINLNSREQKIVPIGAGSSDLYFDRSLQMRLAMVRSKSGGFQLQRKIPDGPWLPAGDYAVEERYGFKILGISADGKTANLVDTLDRDKAALVTLDIQTGRRSLIYENKSFEVSTAIFDQTSKVVLAIKLIGPHSQWLGMNDYMRTRLAYLKKQIGHELTISLCCGEKGQWIIKAISDVGPNQHYLFDVNDLKLTYLSEEQLSASIGHVIKDQEISLKASDGMELRGYLTLPSIDIKAGPFPLVLLVHGGPVGRYKKGFHPQSQWLVNRGYAVLRINFRGSSGFGSAFIRAGFGQWGRTMQQDLRDATKWAIDKKIADPKRIAIMGHSYGGYAALVGVAAENTPFACAVAMSALTDLDAFLKDMRSYKKLVKTPFQKSLLESQLARYKVELFGDVTLDTDVVNLQAVSPLYLSHLIKKPVLMVHGGRDKGVRRKHAWKLYQKLVSKGNDVAFLTFPKLGHSLTGAKNQQTLALVAERFLARCLGGRVEPAPGLIKNQQEQTIKGGYEFEMHGTPLQINAKGPIDPAIIAFEKGLRPAIKMAAELAELWTLEERMEHYKVPGISILVLRKGKISWAKAYGLKAANTSEKVDVNTVFSVGSISKVGAAIIALRLVEQGKLSLDKNVNTYLKRWQLPENEFTAQQPVTLRHLLSHTGGLTVHGFPDYNPGEDIPTILDTLNGRKPSKTPAVRVIFKPGSKFQYSGGGVTIEQLMIEDVTGQPFTKVSEQYLFTPLAMNRSTYQNPLPVEHGNIAKAHNKSGKLQALPRGWETMAELAASGLWTTPTDLAKMVIALMNSYQGTEKVILSEPTTHKMMSSSDHGSYGLGPKIKHTNGVLKFSHGGSNNSYKAWMEGHLPTGNGLIIMSNGADGKGLISEIRRSIASAEGWQVKGVKELPSVILSKDHLAKLAGDYEPSALVKASLKIETIQIRQLRGRVFIHYGKRDADKGTRLLPLDKYTFITQNGASLRYEFLQAKDGSIRHLIARVGTKTYIANKMQH